jgi:hypothetical protein
MAMRALIHIGIQANKRIFLLTCAHACMKCTLVYKCVQIEHTEHNECQNVRKTILDVYALANVRMHVLICSC